MLPGKFSFRTASLEFRISARLQPEKMQDLQGTLRISLQVEYTGHIFPECLRNVAELLKKRRSAFFFRADGRRRLETDGSGMV
ncbi:MAG TPA: hypothetical protein DDW78_10310 [Treponema sp.]|nr:hypothetical protein [Treponema sp.]